MIRLINSIGFFILLTLLMTWPLALQMDQAVIGWIGDNYQYVWMIGWFQKALLEHLSPLQVPLLNYPEGYHLAYTDIPFTQVLLGLVGSFLVNPTFGYNLTLLVSFVLSGVGMFIWVRRLTNCSWAGLVAGTIFAFTPYRMSHVLGHLNLMGTQWFPFYFMGITELLAAPKASWKKIGLPAITIGLIAFTSQYYLYMTLIVSIIYFGIYFGIYLSVDWLFIKDPSRSILDTEFWKKIVIFGMVALPLVVLSMLPYLQLEFQDSTQHTLDEVRIWSASPTDFILPSPQHFLWGSWIEQHFDRSLWIENTLYVGITTVVLAVLAWSQYKSHPTYARLVKLLAGTCLLVFVLALGTDLHGLGQPVLVDVPPFMQRWFPHQQTMIPLPGYFLFKWLPFYAKMRVWMRYGIFVSLFLSVLAGIGVSGLLERAKSTFLPVKPIAIAVMLFILIEFYPRSHPLSKVEYRPVDIWLHKQKEGGVAHFPFWQAKNPQNTLATLMTNKPYIADSFGAFNTAQFRRIQPELDRFPDQTSILLLKELRIRWVIVDSSQYQNFEQVHKTITELGLNFSGTFETQYAYELP